MSSNDDFRNEKCNFDFSTQNPHQPSEPTKLQEIEHKSELVKPNGSFDSKNQQGTSGNDGTGDTIAPQILKRIRSKTFSLETPSIIVGNPKLPHIIEPEIFSKKITNNHKKYDKRPKPAAISNVPYVCDICERKCSTPSKLESHIRIHTGEKPYSCRFCTKKFTQKIHIKGHEKVHVTKGHQIKNNKSEMIHFCKVCKKDFIGPENLEIHEKLHTTPYFCEICGRKCPTPSQLECHKRTHTGEKPYSCSFCNLNFRHSIYIRTVSSLLLLFPGRIYFFISRYSIG